MAINRQSLTHAVCKFWNMETIRRNHVNPLSTSGGPIEAPSTIERAFASPHHYSFPTESDFRFILLTWQLFKGIWTRIVRYPRQHTIEMQFGSRTQKNALNLVCSWTTKKIPFLVSKKKHHSTMTPRDLREAPIGTLNGATISDSWMLQNFFKVRLFIKTFSKNGKASVNENLCDSWML